MKEVILDKEKRDFAFLGGVCVLLTIMMLTMLMLTMMMLMQVERLVD